MMHSLQELVLLSLHKNEVVMAGPLQLVLIMLYISGWCLSAELMYLALRSTIILLIHIFCKTDSHTTTFGFDLNKEF